MDLKRYVGEASEYDKKQAVEHRKPKSWLKSVSAFANTVGGVVVFGVDDNDECIGLEDVKKDSEFISQKMNERISPLPEVIMKIEKGENEKDILFVAVEKGTETPYYYIGDGTTIAYVRIGNESVPANSVEWKRLVLRGKNSSYDSLISNYEYKDFAFSKMRERYKAWTGNSMEEKDFESFGIVDKSGGLVDALDSAEYTGSLIKLLNDGVAFVKRNMKMAWKKTANSRIEMPDYSERSVFEALVNALIHRDYLINGSEVHVDMFDDRLVIYSPGGMADGSQIQECNIDAVPSTRRNPVLADIFSRLGYMERQGSGLNKICNGCRCLANYQPEYEPRFFSNRVEFTVCLPNMNFKTSKNGVLNEVLSEVLGEVLKEELSEEEKKLLDYFEKNPHETQKNASQELKLSKRKVQNSMKRLMERGLLERNGSKKLGIWVVHK